MSPDYFLLAIKSIRKRRLRSWLTMLGIVIAIATIFILISLSLGLREAVNAQFRLLGTDKFFIQPKGQFGPPGTATASLLTKEDAEVVEKVSGVKDISYIKVENAKVEYKNEIRYSMVLGMPSEHLEVFVETGSIGMDEGKFLEKNTRGKLVLGYDFKYKQVFKKSVEVNEKLKINKKELKINGIVKKIGNPQDDKNIYLSMDDFDEIFNKTGIDAIYVQIKEGEDIKEVAERVERRLLQFRKISEKKKDFTILTPEELLGSFGNILNIVTAFLLGIAAISLLVGGIGIANTMYTSVLERTREIGVMKAIGARNSDILYIFLIEAGMLGLVGGIAGIVFGVGIVKAVEYYAINILGTNLLRAGMSFYLFFACFVFAFVIGSLSGLLPALQASKLRPVEALRYE